ncbi:hypothetical protein C5167_041066 [Papaver somniferum]|uniref:Uncharacterized protein n=1 Tax=Papaver somniferum TaxID=3469 RepID=A0A4Y7IJ62_PAPSO|nr:hypothetical protein C5167_041066 [Papaver somniferum]
MRSYSLYALGLATLTALMCPLFLRCIEEGCGGNNRRLAMLLLFIQSPLSHPTKYKAFMEHEVNLLVDQAQRILTALLKGRVVTHRKSPAPIHGTGAVSGINTVLITVIFNSLIF